MEQTTFKKFCEIIYSRSGITLNSSKEALVSARVSKRMRMLNLQSHGDYLEYVLQDQSGEEIVQLLDVISTNVTYFFREAQHFEFLSREMHKWLDSGQSRFRFWSAGCSSGEEPYSLAMTLREVTTGTSPDIRILATDISTRVLAKSIAGEYDSRKIDDVPPAFRDRYFEKETSANGLAYRINDQLRRMIVFQRLNLSIIPYPMKGPLDAIFCRNVMIYFDNDVRLRLLREFTRLLKPGGILFVGHAESLAGMLLGMKSVIPSVYIKG